MTKRAASEHSQSTAPATSSGFPILPIGSAAQVRVYDPIPLFLSNFRCRCILLSDTGVVEGKVESPEGFKRLSQDDFHILSARHVAPDRQRTPPEFLDHPGGLLIAFFRDI